MIGQAQILPLKGHLDSEQKPDPYCGRLGLIQATCPKMFT